MTQYVVATTSRSTIEAETHGSILHAISLPPRRGSRTGHTYIAACGAQVARIHDGRLWHWGLKRACRHCRHATGA